MMTFPCNALVRSVAGLGRLLCILVVALLWPTHLANASVAYVLPQTPVNPVLYRMSIGSAIDLTPVVRLPYFPSAISAFAIAESSRDVVVGYASGEVRRYTGLGEGVSELRGGGDRDDGLRLEGTLTGWLDLWPSGGKALFGVDGPAPIGTSYALVDLFGMRELGRLGENAGVVTSAALLRGSGFIYVSHQRGVSRWSSAEP